jgi:acetyltransferase-like isoleucine patch superfamily enzyme
MLFGLILTVRKFKIFQYPNVIFGKNIQLQTLLGLKAECPNAYIYLDDDCIIYENAKLEAYDSAEIRIGEMTILGDVRIYARKKISLGKRVLVSWNVMIQDYNPHPINQQERRSQVECIIGRSIVNSLKPNYFASDEIFIGDDVWLGANSIVLKGAHIEEGCIVSAGSVVYKGHYPARSLIIGNPAKVTKTLESTTKQL